MSGGSGRAQSTVDAGGGGGCLCVLLQPSVPLPLLCAVAVKNDGAKEAEGDGGCGNRAALGSAAVPEGELLLQVSAASWQMPCRDSFQLCPFQIPGIAPKEQAVPVLIAGCSGEAVTSWHRVPGTCDPAEV